MMPTDLVARANKELVSQMIRRSLAWIPVAMSLAILAMVLTTIGISGAVRQEDEGTQAHIFQIWLVLEVVLVAVFAVEWVPRRPKQALMVLAIQILCAVAACAPVFYLGCSFGTQHERLSVRRALLGCPNLHRLCRARPADRSLVAEPAGTRWVHTEPAGRGTQRARAVTTGAKEPQVSPPA